MSDAEIKNISLLYEFDNHSPLFARIAFLKMEEENFSEAKEILVEGLKEFPHYPTPYFLLAETNAKLGNLEEAKENLAKGHVLLGSKETFQFYQEKISEAENKFKNFDSPLSTDFTPQEADVEPQVQETSDEKPIENQTEEKVPLEERLDQLAQELQNAKIPAPDGTETNSVEESADESVLTDEETSYEDLEIASETLGMILESQGKFEEAKEVYEKLLKIEPEKKEIYESKIQELTERIAETNE